MTTTLALESLQPINDTAERVATVAADILKLQSDELRARVARPKEAWIADIINTNGERDERGNLPFSQIVIGLKHIANEDIEIRQDPAVKVKPEKLHSILNGLAEMAPKEHLDLMVAFADDVENRIIGAGHFQTAPSLEILALAAKKGVAERAAALQTTALQSGGVVVGTVVS